jgi:hypothetical protein
MTTLKTGLLIGATALVFALMASLAQADATIPDENAAEIELGKKDGGHVELGGKDGGRIVELGGKDGGRIVELAE